LSRDELLATVASGLAKANSNHHRTMSATDKAPETTRPGHKSLREHKQAEKARADRHWRWLRKLLFGDWTPALRDPLDVLRLSFAATSVGFLLTGHSAIAGTCSFPSSWWWQPAA
jgi:hypothetical protein